jgi:hypothetical protein
VELVKVGTVAGGGLVVEVVEVALDGHGGGGGGDAVEVVVVAWDDHGDDEAVEA